MTFTNILESVIKIVAVWNKSACDNQSESSLLSANEKRVKILQWQVVMTLLQKKATSP